MDQLWGNPFNLAETDRLLTTTRAVRRRLDVTKPVPINLILECLDIAIQAPSGSMNEGWRWIIVTDQMKRAHIEQAYLAAGEDYLQTEEGRSMSAELRELFETAPFANGLLGQVPVHVIPCIVGRPEGLPSAGLATLYGSILPAVWNFMLALRSRGLGSTMTTRHLYREREVANVLGIPFDSVTQVALVPVAYTHGHRFRAARRTAIRDLAFLNEWGSTP